MNEFAISLSVFIITYILIMSEKINRMVVALFGAAIIIALNILTEHEALSYIDSDTIILLLSMMIIVNIMKRTGIFEYIAIRIAKLSKGSPTIIMVLFSVFTAIASAFLDNVTTILLVAPVTIVIANQLKINPVLFIIPEVMLANIGGTATLIGDPPNIMIGSKAGLTFIDFIFNMAPVVIIISIVMLLSFKFIYRKSLHSSVGDFKEILQMDEKLAIKDKVLLIKSITILIITIIGFLLSHTLHLEAATIALIAAATLLFISKVDPDEIMHDIEWTTLFFFGALFMLVGALEKVGAISMLANILIKATNGNLFLTTMAILWGSAIASSFLDNIPFVATMIPLIQSIGADMPGVDIHPLWWALALGACLGGNGTIIGASANVIAVGALEKQKHKLSFLEFMKIGFPTMIISIIISTIYLTIKFFI